MDSTCIAMAASAGRNCPEPFPCNYTPGVSAWLLGGKKPKLAPGSTFPGEGVLNEAGEGPLAQNRTGSVHHQATGAPSCWGAVLGQERREQAGEGGRGTGSHSRNIFTVSSLRLRAGSCEVQALLCFENAFEVYVPPAVLLTPTLGYLQDTSAGAVVLWAALGPSYRRGPASLGQSRIYIESKTARYLVSSIHD